MPDGEQRDDGAIEPLDHDADIGRQQNHRGNPQWIEAKPEMADFPRAAVHCYYVPAKKRASIARIHRQPSPRLDRCKGARRS